MNFVKFATKPLVYIIISYILLSPISPAVQIVTANNKAGESSITETGSEISNFTTDIVLDNLNEGETSSSNTQNETGTEIHTLSPTSIEFGKHEIEVCFVNLDEKGQVLANLPVATNITFPVYLEPGMNSNTGLPDSYGTNRIDFEMDESTENNAHLWSNSGNLDAYCETYEMEIPANTNRIAYAYGEAEVNDPLNEWYQTRYHDGYQNNFNNPNDAQRYSDELFTNGNINDRNNLSDGHINLYGADDNRRIVVVNKIEKRVLPKVIHVCFVTIDWNGNFLDGKDLNGNTSFHISLYSNLTNEDGKLTNSLFGRDFKDINVPGDFENNYDTFGNDGINDTHCTSTELITKDKNLGYSLVSIDSDQQFRISKYNDSYGGNPNSVNDFYDYSYELFDTDSTNDNDRNQKSDGHLVVGENEKPRKIFVLNQFIENTTPVDIEFVKKNESQSKYDDIDGDPDDYKGIDYVNEETNKLKTSYISYKARNNDPDVTKYVRFSWDGHNWTTINELAKSTECPARPDGTEINICNTWDGEEVLQKREGFEKEGLYTRFIEIIDEFGNVRVEGKDIIYDKTPPADNATKHLNLGVHEYDYDPPSYTSENSAWALFKFEDNKKPVSVADPNYRLPDSFVSGINEIYFFTEKSDLGWEPYEDGKIKRKLISYSREVREACEDEDGSCSAGLYLGVKLKDRAGNISTVYSTNFDYYFNDKYHDESAETAEETEGNNTVLNNPEILTPEEVTGLDNTVEDEDEPFPDCRVTPDDNYVIVKLRATRNLDQEWEIDKSSIRIPCPLITEAIANPEGTEFNTKGIAPNANVIFVIDERIQLCEGFWCANKYQTYPTRSYVEKNSNLIDVRVYISDNKKEYRNIYSTPIGSNDLWFRKTYFNDNVDYGFQEDDRVYAFTRVTIDATENSGDKLNIQSKSSGERISFHIPNKLDDVSSNASKGISIEKIVYSDSKKQEDTYFHDTSTNVDYTGKAHNYAIDGMDDVAEGNVFFDYIRNLIEDNVLNGYSDGKFRPDNSVTREQMAKFIVNGFGVTTDPDCASKKQFDDVDQNNPFFLYINTLKCEGIISGYSGGNNYRPGKNLTRGEATKFLVEAIENKNGLSDISVFLPSINHSYNDAKGDTFEKYIGILDNLRVQPGNVKIINGYSTTPPEFRPRENITRGQMAKIIDIGRRYVFDTNLVENVVDFDIDYSEIDALGQVEIDLTPSEDNGSIFAYGGLFGDDLAVWISDNVSIAEDIINYESEITDLDNLIEHIESWSLVPDNADCEVYLIDCLYSINDTVWGHSETVKDLNASLIGLTLGMITGFADGVSYIEKFNDVVDTLEIFQNLGESIQEFGQLIGKISANPAVLAVIFDNILAEYSAAPTREDRMNVLGKFIGNVLGEIYTEVTVGLAFVAVGGPTLAASITSKIMSVADKYFDISRYTGKVITVVGKVGAEIIEFGGKHGFDSATIKNIINVANEVEFNQLIRIVKDEGAVNTLTRVWKQTQIKGEMVLSGKRYPNTASRLAHVIVGDANNKRRGLHHAESVIEEFKSGRLLVRDAETGDEIMDVDGLIRSIDHNKKLEYFDLQRPTVWSGTKTVFPRNWSVDDVAEVGDVLNRRILADHANNVPGEPDLYEITINRKGRDITIRGYHNGTDLFTWYPYYD